MESQNLSDTFTDLSDNVKHYVRLRINLLKLTITEKMARIVSMLMLTIIFFIVFLFFLFFVSLAFIFWYRDQVGPAWAGALWMAGFYILVGGIVYLLRRTFFINPVISHLSTIIMEDDEDEDA